MDHKLLTVAIPTYNRAKYLKRTLESVVSQYEERVEIIVSDNASEDNTRQVVEELSASAPIRYIRNEKNMGAEANFLQCYRVATGDFILLLGDDDLIVENRLATMLDYIEENPQSDWVFVNQIYIRGEYIDAQHYIQLWSRDETNRSDVSKRAFLDYAKQRITFISCQMLSLKAFRKIEQPEKYIETCFLHTCLGFEATRSETAHLGIIGVPCIAADMGAESDRMSEASSINPRNTYRYFVKWMEYVLCTLGAQFGYDRAQLVNAWKTGIQYLPAQIIVMKAGGQGYMKEEFDRYARPVLKKYPSMYLKVKLAMLVPSWVCRGINKYVKPMRRRIRDRLLGSGQ